MQNNPSIPATISAQSVSSPGPAEALFIETLARALHRFGLPSHRIEDALARIAGRLRIRGQFFATPTAIFASLDAGGDTRTVLMRMDPGEVNLDKLSRLDELLDAVISGELSLEAATARAGEIVDSPGRYGAAITALGFALASGTATRFFGGGWREFVVSTLVGLAAGALAATAERFPTRFRVFEPTAALLAGFVTALAGATLHPLSTYVAMCGGLIVLIPGLTLTTSINELATRNLAAGTVRMMGALILFLEIGFGVAVGLKVGSLLVGTPPSMVAPTPLPGWTLPVALLIAPLSFTVLFQASMRDVGWITAASALAFAGARAGSHAMGPEMGAFTGALAVGVAANRPASVTLVPGIMLLVPGSVGFQSVSSLMAHDVVSGVQTAFTVSLLAVALVTGLLLANAIVPPRKSL